MSGLAALWAWAHCRAARHFRRRGAFLLAFGAIYGVYGSAILTDPSTPFAALGPFGSILDTPLWGLLWLACAVVAVGVAVRRHVLSDVAGYNALLIPPSVWALTWAWSGVLWIGSGGDMGAARAWASAAIWSSAIVSVLVVAGWPEPPRDGEKC